MRRVVLDPSAFLAWFDGDPDRMRAEYEAGSLEVLVPPIFDTHVLEVAAAAVSDPARLGRLAAQLDHVGFVRRDPSVGLVAGRIADGWPVLAAQYAALAEELDAPLVAGDPDLRRRASGLLLRP